MVTKRNRKKAKGVFCGRVSGREKLTTALGDNANSWTQLVSCCEFWDGKFKAIWRVGGGKRRKMSFITWLWAPAFCRWDRQICFPRHTFSLVEFQTLQHRLFIELAQIWWNYLTTKQPTFNCTGTPGTYCADSLKIVWYLELQKSLRRLTNSSTIHFTNDRKKK